MTEDPIIANVRALRECASAIEGQARAMVSVAVALMSAFEPPGAGAQQARCPKCGDAKYQAQARPGEYVCGADGCGQNYEVPE